MRRRRAHLATITAAALLVSVAAVATEPPTPDADASRAERSLLRHLHFQYGLVVACGLADDEVEAGYNIRASKLEQQLGIDHDSDARYRELNLGWTEADADWAAKGGAVFRDWCRNQAALARDRFRQAFRDTGLSLNPRPDGRRERKP